MIRPLVFISNSDITTDKYISGVYLKKIFNTLKAWASYLYFLTWLYIGWHHFFSEMAILWGFLRYTTKCQKFWLYGLFKAARPKRKKILKIKYGSKCLELFNSARNAKIAKNFQKVPGRWSSLNLAFKGLKIGNIC